MPSETEAKFSDESEESHASWWSKCISTISVRERRRSSTEPRRSNMTVTDSPKKRKRTPSAGRGRKISFQAGRQKVVNMDIENMDIREIFDAQLKLTSPVEAYDRAHAELLKKEDEDAWDRNARYPINATEQRAAIIIHAIREYERRKTFGNLPSEAIPGPETLDMGGQFLTNKDRVDTESELFQIAKLVPKGALLHLHFNAELNPERLLEQAKHMPNMYIRSILPLDEEEALHKTEMVFSVLNPEGINTDVDIFSPSYPGRATNWKQPDMQDKIWMKWSIFRDKFKEKFPNITADQRRSNPVDPNKPVRICCSDEPALIELDPAEFWLKSKMILSPEEAYGHTQTVNGVWARFNQATRCFKGLLNYEGVYKWYIGEAIEKMIKEGVMYAELRPMLLDKFIPSNDGKKRLDNATQMRMVAQGVKNKKDELEKAGKLDQFPFGLKIVYCTPRSIPKAMMQEEMKQCIELKKKFPELICGFDLVGAEDRPNHIGFYKEELVAFKATCKANNLDIPFLFHAGESLLDAGGSDDPSKSNLYDSVVLEAKRIGHGFALMKHPHLVDKFRRKVSRRGVVSQKGICVELCPISNELLHLCRNIKEHPFPELLAAGIPCTVNSDNPSLFSNSMNHEFYQVMVGAPTMSLYSWKQLARWSLEYSCLTDDEIKRGLDILDRTWSEFCDQIVEKYDKALMDGDQINEKRAAAFYEAQLEKPKKDETTETSNIRSS